VQDGVLDLDAKVCRYWPEFAAHGKEEITLRQLLAHQAGMVATDLGFTAEELADEPLVPAIRRSGPASFGGVASARGLARMYATAIGSVDGAPPPLRPETAATFAQAHSVGRDLVSREHRAFGVGFQITSEYYPVLGQGSFGHSGAGGQQAFADPRNALSYGYSRRRSSFPGGAAPENDRLIRAVHAAATSRRERST
jgi:CubicO group peptidase (beta-lactamase class C family)